MGGSVSWTVLVIYLVVIIGIGLWLSRRVVDSEDLMLAGRKAGRWLIAFSIGATWVNGATLMGGTGVGYNTGSGTYWLHMGFMTATIWAGIYLIPRIRRLKVITIPELFGRYFGNEHRNLAAVLVLARDLGASAGVIVAMNVLAMQFFGLTFVQGLLLTYVFTVLYCILAGQWAVLWTDSIQFFVLVIGTVGLLIGVIAGVGGLASFKAAIPDPKYLQFFGSNGMQIAGWLFMGSLVTVGYQSIFQRGMAAIDENEARWGFIYGGIFGVIWYILPYLLGVTGAVVYGADIAPNMIYLSLATEFFSPAIAGLFLAAFLASCMSSIDSTLLSVASTLTVDIFKRIRPNASEKQTLLAGRINIALAGLIAAILAFAVPLILELFFIGGRILAAGLSPVLIGVIFYKPFRRAKKTILLSMLAGAVVTTTMIILSKRADIVEGVVILWKLDPVIVGLAATLVTMFLGTYIEYTRKQSSNVASRA
jgi:solute:Na+ symporter, SSS family